MSLRRPGYSPASIDISSAIEWPSLVVLLLLFPLSIRSISPGRLHLSDFPPCPFHSHSCILVAENMGILADIVVCSELPRIRYYLSQAFNLSTAGHIEPTLLTYLCPATALHWLSFNHWTLRLPLVSVHIIPAPLPPPLTSDYAATTTAAPSPWSGTGE